MRWAQGVRFLTTQDLASHEHPIQHLPRLSGLFDREGLVCWEPAALYDLQHRPIFS